MNIWAKYQGYSLDSILCIKYFLGLNFHHKTDNFKFRKLNICQCNHPLMLENILLCIVSTLNFHPISHSWYQLMRKCKFFHCLSLRNLFYTKDKSTLSIMRFLILSNLRCYFLHNFCFLDLLHNFEKK